LSYAPVIMQLLPLQEVASHRQTLARSRD